MLVCDFPQGCYLVPSSLKVNSCGQWLSSILPSKDCEDTWHELRTCQVSGSLGGGIMRCVLLRRAAGSVSELSVPWIFLVRRDPWPPSQWQCSLSEGVVCELEVTHPVECAKQWLILMLLVTMEVTQVTETP